MLRTLLELGRISNLPTVWSNLTAGWILGGGDFDPLTLLGLYLGGSLLYLAGMTLNDAAGADFDREHKADRPIVRGHISESATWMLGWGYLISGFLLLHQATPAYGTHITAITALILGYTFTHKKWAGCTYLMGAIRGCLYLMAGGAAIASQGQVPTGLGAWLPLLWGSVLGIYVVYLTAVARQETRSPQSALPLPLPMIALPLIAVLIQPTLPDLGGFLVLCFCAAVFLAWVFWLGKDLKAKRIGPAVGKMLAGMVLLDALAVSTHQPYLALLFVALAPLLLLWQRFVAAT